MNIAVSLPHWTLITSLHITPLSSTNRNILRVEIYFGVSWAYFTRGKKWRENPVFLFFSEKSGRKKPRHLAEAKYQLFRG